MFALAERLADPEPRECQNRRDPRRSVPGFVWDVQSCDRRIDAPRERALRAHARKQACDASVKGLASRKCVISFGCQPFPVIPGARVPT